MAISVNPLTYVITVPKADLTFVSGVVYQLDLDDFRGWLNDWEDSVEGVVQRKTHNHNTEVVLSGITYARIIEVLAPYTVEFEDGQYIVSCTGANHNLADVKVANQVSIIVNNAAGLIIHVSGSGLSTAEADMLQDLHNMQGFEDGDPMTVTPTSRTTNRFSVTISGDGETTTTVTRD